METSQLMGRGGLEHHIKSPVNPLVSNEGAVKGAAFETETDPKPAQGTFADAASPADAQDAHQNTTNALSAVPNARNDTQAPNADTQDSNAKGYDFAAALAMIAALPLSATEKAQAVRRLMASQAKGDNS